MNGGTEAPVPTRVFAGRRVLVTGGTGFVGAALVRMLADSGARLWLHGRDERKLAIEARRLESPVECVVAELSMAGTGARMVRDIRPDIVFNLAAYGVDPTSDDEALAHALNVALVEELATALAAEPPGEWPGARLVHTGSAAEYGIVPGVLTEQSPGSPATLYGRTKLAGSCRLAALAAETGLRAVTVRLFTVYGFGEREGRLLPSLFAAAASGGTLRLTSGTQKRDFTYVADVAEGLIRLGASASALPPVVNLATGTLTSVREFAETAADVIGMRREQLEFDALPRRSDEVEQGRADTGTLRRLVHWTPACTIRTGIREAFELDAGRWVTQRGSDRS